MHYVIPTNPDLGGIGQPMDPLALVDQAIALGPTYVAADPAAGYFRQRQLGGWGEAFNVLTAIDFLFPQR